MLRIYTQFMKACNFCRKNPLYLISRHSVGPSYLLG